MEKIILDTKKGKYAGLFSKGTKYNNIAFVYYHGLNGKSKIVQPLLKSLSEFDFYSMEERGHENSLQKPSISIKKHDNDIKNVVDFLSEKYDFIYLCGESMGGLFTSRSAYTLKNLNGVFSWSIPFNPKDIMTEKKSKKFIIFLRVFLCFLFGWNYKYVAIVDYPKLTNSKFLMKLYELQVKSVGSTSEEIAIWKASIGLKRKFLKKTPNVPIYYWQGTEDIMVNKKLIDKISKNKKIHMNLVPGGKHILMFEQGSENIWKKMKEIALENLNKTH